MYMRCKPIPPAQRVFPPLRSPLTFPLTSARPPARPQTGRQPDILHCHDWQTAPVAKYYWDDYQRFGLPNSRVVLTIHNMQYGAGLIGEAMEYCQKATTVSRTYAEEVSGHGALNKNLHKFRGIVNGIDPEIWRAGPARGPRCEQTRAAGASSAQLARTCNRSREMLRPLNENEEASSAPGCVCIYPSSPPLSAMTKKQSGAVFLRQGSVR